MADPLLVLEGVSFRSEEGRIVFDGLDWTLARGAKVRLRSSSGRDASVLLRLASGLALPQAGRVVLDGVPLGPYSFDHPFLARGALGWVPREGGLLVNQDLLANLVLPLLFTKRLGAVQASSMAAAALEEAGLSGLADQRPHAMDPGERWLAALVRATLMAPELWLVDPPAGHLPRSVQETASALLERAAASQAAMILLGEASWMPKVPMQAIGLDNGRLMIGDA